MKRAFVLSTLLILVFAFHAFPCFNPTDYFATEVVLNKQGVNHNLEQVKVAANVSAEEGAFAYRCHYDTRVGAILKEINESEPAEMLKGLSVKIQIPTKHVIKTRNSTIVRFELEGVALGAVNKDLLKALGYEVSVLNKPVSDDPDDPDDPDDRDVAVSISLKLKKADTNLSIIQHQTGGQDKVEFVADIEGASAFSDGLKAEFKEIVASLGLPEDVLDRVDPEMVEIDHEDLVEAVEVDRDEFDFRAAMNVELAWLADNEIISGIGEEDIAEIAEVAEPGLAGWNRRIVYDSGRWLPYNETGNPMLFRGVDCGGFGLEKLPGDDQTIILPGTSSVSSDAKLSTKWGKLKAGL